MFYIWFVPNCNILKIHPNECTVVWLKSRHVENFSGKNCGNYVKFWRKHKYKVEMIREMPKIKMLENCILLGISK